LTDGGAPTFGLWYDFRQPLPLGDYSKFYEECLEEIVAGEDLGYADVWLSEHHFVDDGYLPSPLVVAAARTDTMGINHDEALGNMRLFALEVALKVPEAVAS